MGSIRPELYDIIMAMADAHCPKAWFVQNGIYKSDVYTTDSIKSYLLSNMFMTVILNWMETFTTNIAKLKFYLKHKN